ncbi:hypothetical protein HMPREF1536_03646 [Parabacteroides gordonii MS-1 = DSM 23371]|uniref:Bro-N domain-containing protein n=2 Tax=Parabacteroides gordonii TaxID=574930 RepID=A0A0F5J9A2_9BACT|nr:hypothetical protein HMPREF1536_03646 [Parabacteroides gordonii MS-1 = DSM 23371]
MCFVVELILYICSTIVQTKSQKLNSYFMEEEKSNNKKKLQIRNSTAEFLIFQLQDKEEGVEIVYKDETLWVSQKAMSILFDVDRTVITKHLKSIFDAEELDKDSVCAIFAHTAEDGKIYQTQHYNLDAVISVGYRVNSVRATQFRQWCTAVLRQFAIHRHTAAELIRERANAEKEHMGLTTWENSPNGKIVKTDVSIAKNYLKEAELDDMGHLVNAFLDLAESRAKRHIPMTMEDWAKHLDRILSLDDRALLSDNGKVSAEEAKMYAESEFEKYRIVQDRLFESDFDREIKGLFDKE